MPDPFFSSCHCRHDACGPSFTCLQRCRSETSGCPAHPGAARTARCRGNPRGCVVSTHPAGCSASTLRRPRSSQGRSGSDLPTRRYAGTQAARSARPGDVPMPARSQTFRPRRASLPPSRAQRAQPAGDRQFADDRAMPRSKARECRLRIGAPTRLRISCGTDSGRSSVR